MRALQFPDAFPPGDVGLLRGMASLGEPVSKAELLPRAEAWRPWRAYAAMYLWAASAQPSVSVATTQITPPQMEALSA